MAEIKILYSDMTSRVRQQLAIIGKHHKAQTGGTLFATATLSEIERDVMPMFVATAAQTIVGELSPIVERYELSNDTLTLVVDNTRMNEAMQAGLEYGVMTYVVASVVLSVLNMSVPDIAPRYATDVQQQMAALVRMAFAKDAPSVGDEVQNVSGEVTMESKDTADGYSRY